MAHAERVTDSSDAEGSSPPAPFAAVVEANRGVWAHLAPPGVSMVDELIAERRREAAKEDEE